jgi:hypothetical protein
MYERTHSCRNLPSIPTFLLRICTTFGVSYQNRKLENALKQPILQKLQMFTDRMGYKSNFECRSLKLLQLWNLQSYVLKRHEFRL